MGCRGDAHGVKDTLGVPGGCRVAVEEGQG